MVYTNEGTGTSPDVPGWAKSSYDAAGLGAAEELGACRVDSEARRHGQEYEGVKVIKPFHGLDTAFW